MLPILTVSEARVVADPELRYAATGTAVGKFRIVTNDRIRNDQGEWVDGKALWLEVTCFKQLAENCAESLRKGDMVSVTGKLQTDQWETEAGDKRSRDVLIADSVAVSLRFRTVQHGEGRTERATAPAAADPWASSSPPVGQTDEPPF